MSAQDPSTWNQELATAERDYQNLVAQELKLDLTRGKPAAAQLTLSAPMAGRPGDDFLDANGVDARNYGGLEGLRQARELLAPALDLPADQVVIGGNSSLELMYLAVSNCLLLGAPGGDPWAGQDIAFLCPSPGYDRHFTICEALGIRMIVVPMTDSGPDMDVVESLVAEDASIKGMWCVPKYSNPTGVTYSPDTVRRLATMNCAATDFTIFWDNAYASHHLTDTHDELDNLVTACQGAGNPTRTIVFASTSKITWAGAGISCVAGSPEVVTWWLNAAQARTIGPDKMNQLRHIQFLRDAAGLAAHMREHANILAPKFAAVDQALTKELGGSGLATWTKPRGGYFVSLDVLPGCASDVVALAKAAGIALTPAGSTFPYGQDPDDSNIRLAPSFPTLDDVEQAMAAVGVCVRLASYRKLVADQANAAV